MQHISKFWRSLSKNMCTVYILLLVALVHLDVTCGFALRNINRRNPSSINNRVRESGVKLNSFVDFSSALIAVGDYAAEIEKGVGEEIYAPIFKSGLVLFGSGLISAFMAAAIVAKSDSWEELGLEFERGKVAQLIDLDVSPNAAPVAPVVPIISVATELSISSNSGEEKVEKVEAVVKEEKIVKKKAVAGNDDGVYDMDI